jgi:hypothetical protein
LCQPSGLIGESVNAFTLAKSIAARLMEVQLCGRCGFQVTDDATDQAAPRS